MAYNIQKGTDAKFRVTISAAGFDMERDYFEVRLFSQWADALLITKEDMLVDGKGGYYITIPRTLDYGTYVARTTAHVPDDDYDDNLMHLVDEQVLLTVGGCCRHGGGCGCQHEDGGMKVSFERVYTAGIDTNIYLADKDGNYIFDSEGRRIMLDKGQ